MRTTPVRPGTKSEIDEATKAILTARLATFEEDRKTAVDAREALMVIRKNLKHAKPR